MEEKRKNKRKKYENVKERENHNFRKIKKGKDEKTGKM